MKTDQIRMAHVHAAEMAVHGDRLELAIRCLHEAELPHLARMVEGAIASERLARKVRDQLRECNVQLESMLRGKRG